MEADSRAGSDRLRSPEYCITTSTLHDDDHDHEDDYDDDCGDDHDDGFDNDVSDADGEYYVYRITTSCNSALYDDDQDLNVDREDDDDDHGNGSHDDDEDHLSSFLYDDNDDDDGFGDDYDDADDDRSGSAEDFIMINMRNLGTILSSLTYSSKP